MDLLIYINKQRARPLAIPASTAPSSETGNRTDYWPRHVVRAVALPAEADGNNAKATFNDGVLELTLPKAEHARARHIAIE